MLKECCFLPDERSDTKNDKDKDSTNEASSEEEEPEEQESEEEQSGNFTDYGTQLGAAMKDTNKETRVAKMAKIKEKILSKLNKYKDYDLHKYGKYYITPCPVFGRLTSGVPQRRHRTVHLVHYGNYPEEISSSQYWI